MPPQPNSGADVADKGDQTAKAKDVAKGIKDSGDQAAFDLVAELSGGGQPTTEETGESEANKAESESQVENNDNKENSEQPKPTEQEEQKENNAQESEKSDKKPEEKPDDSNSVEPFAVLGDLQFESKEDLLDYLDSNVGYNRWMTGIIKKAHPDWFGADGKIIASKAEAADRVISGIKKEASEGERPAITEDEKNNLRAIGIVFKEDLEQATNSLGLESTQTQLDSFVKEHPAIEKHYDEVAELMESTSDLPKERRLSLPQAWGIVANRHGINEETKKTDAKSTGNTFEEGVKAGKKKSGMDSQIPNSPAAKSGVAPKGNSAPKDFMDEVMGATGM